MAFPTESPFFKNAPTDEKPAETPEDGAQEDFFAPPDPDAKAEKKTPETVPYERLAKEVAKRKALEAKLGETSTEVGGLKEALAEAKGRVSALEPAAESAKNLAAVYGERYASREDGAAALNWDAAFLGLLDEGAVERGDQKLIEALKPYIDRMKQGETTTVKTTESIFDKAAKAATPEAAAVAAAAPDADPAVQAILAKDLRRTIDEALPDIKGPFRAIVAEDLLGKGKALDLASLTPAQARKHAAEIFEGKGFTYDEVKSAESGEKAAKAKAKPNVDSAEGVDTTERKVDPSSEEADPNVNPDGTKRAASREEFLKQKDSRRAKLIASITSDA